MQELQANLGAAAMWLLGLSQIPIRSLNCEEFDYVKLETSHGRR